MNSVRLIGVVSVRKSWPANGEKQAMVFASIRPRGESKASIDVKAFGEAAEALGNADGYTADCEGRVAYEKPKDSAPGGAKVRWPMCVVIEKAVEVPPRGHAQPADDNGMPF